MTETFTIRPAAISDADTLCTAEQETAKIQGLLVSQPHELTIAAFEKKIRLLSPKGSYLVAEKNGIPVGHALLEPMSPQAMSHVFSLTIIVHPGYLKRGIGTMLMEALMAWAKRSPEVEKVELRVREGNAPAKALYRRFGFVEEGILSKRIKLGEHVYLADIFMGRHF